MKDVIISDISNQCISVEPCDMYVAIISFLEKYNEDMRSEDIICLKSEMGQPHLAQRTYYLWLVSFKKVLLTFRLLDKESDLSKNILPEFVKTNADYMYQAIVEFLENYNENLQSNDIQSLIIKMKQPTLFSSLWQEWECIFKASIEMTINNESYS